MPQFTNLSRVIVAIDPAVSNNSQSDETGIIVAGKGYDGFGYILDDLTMKGTPEQWATRAINAYRDYHADRIIAEVNNGGDLVQQVIRSVDRMVPYKAVRASRGKVTRAEPIVSLYEQGRIFHIKEFPLLEEQMCNFAPQYMDKSPDRVDALVWALTELMLESHAPPQIF